MRADRALIAVAVVALCASALITHSHLPAGSEGPWRLPPAEAAVRGSRDAIGESVRRVVAGDPFRLARRPADLPFGAAAPGATAPAAERPPAPILTGILGPPWRAVLEGVRGVDGARLVARGDTIGGWRVADVRLDLVVIQAEDTTWRMTLRKP